MIVDNVKGRKGLRERKLMNILILIYLIMVRLEKVIYEKAISGLNRAKTIGAPRKWFYSNPYEHLRCTLADTK